MKKLSLALVIISSIGIIIGQTITLLNPTIISQRITSGSFIGLGVGAILIGTYMLKKNNKKE